jgi:hypothetical protein
MLAQLGDVRRHSIHDDAFGAGRLGGECNPTANRAMPVVAGAVDDKNVARAHLSERIVEDRAVGAREPHRYGSPGDPRDVKHRPYCGIDETEIEEMPDRSGLGLLEQREEVWSDLGRQLMDREHSFPLRR